MNAKELRSFKLNIAGLGQVQELVKLVSRFLGDKKSRKDAGARAVLNSFNAYFCDEFGDFVCFVDNSFSRLRAIASFGNQL